MGVAIDERDAAICALMALAFESRRTGRDTRPMYHHRAVKQARSLLPVLLIVTLGSCRTDPEELEARDVARLLSLHDGATVADIGAGNGKFTVALAGRLGSGVHVVATELGRPALLTLWKGVQAGGTGNVSVVEGTATDTHLPAGSCDAIIVRRTYHHFMQPAEMAASLFRTLRPGARLIMIEQPFVRVPAVAASAPARRGGDGIMPSVLIEELAAAGFRHERTVDPFARQLYLVVMRKP
jgi:ubiquinone/menaquinone biosynthesis C-methylase UbiE